MIIGSESGTFLKTLTSVDFLILRPTIADSMLFFATRYCDHHLPEGCWRDPHVYGHKRGAEHFGVWTWFRCFDALSA